MQYTMSLDNQVVRMGKGAPLVLVAGPCVIENAAIVNQVAATLKDICADLKIPYIFKASYDKANRTAVSSFRGPGLKDGLAILADVKAGVGVPVLSDVHRISEIAEAARVLDVIQIPAFLCRQTDFVIAVARAGKPVNVKKGQFLAPWDMGNVVEKIRSAGNHQIMITDRGTMFGYNNLVSDFRGIKIMQDLGCPVVFDVTHSVQLPGGAGNSSGGQREFGPILARAAVAAGADAIFMEVHPDPDNALCDGPNSLYLDDVPALLTQLVAIRGAL